MAGKERSKQARQLSIFVLGVVCFVVVFYYLSQLLPEKGDEYQSAYNIKVGEVLVLNVPGRVSIEYRWQVNSKKSTGLELVSINHIGWIYPKEEKERSSTSAFGKPRTAKFYIRTKAPGISKIAFEYKRRGIEDDVPQRTRDITINITP